MNKNILFLICCLLVSSVLTSQNNAMEDFYSNSSIRQIKITFKQENWRSILDSLRKNGDDYLIGNVNIDGTTYANIGVKYRGSKSFKIGAKRNPLHIKLNFIDKNQSHQGYKSIKLSNALRDPSMVREVLGFEIARKYMPAPQANYAQVMINRENYGVFPNIESVGSEYLSKHFGDSEGSFFYGKSARNNFTEETCKKNVYAALVHEEEVACYLPNYELKSENGWDDLIHLTATLDKNPAEIEKVLHVDRTLWMLAFNNVLVNLSSYSGRQSQNFFLYQDATGRFSPIIWDLNLSFGSYKSATVGSDFRLKQLQELDPLLHIDNPYKPLISKLLENPYYKKTYLSHIRTILYENFVNGEYFDRAQTLQRLIQVPYSKDPNKQYGFDDFKKSLKATIGKKSRIPGIKELMNKRAKVLKKHAALRVIPPEITDVIVLKREQYETEVVNQFTIQVKVNKLPQKVKLRYRYTSKEGFTEVEMLDNGKVKDAKAGDSIYSVTINKGTGAIEYYIIAENKASISFDPVHYMYDLHRADIDELN